MRWALFFLLAALLRVTAKAGASSPDTFSASAAASIKSPALDHAANGKPRAVIELFTSQGCASCVPADALLGEYAGGTGDVLALTYPVTIWDYLGWRDTLARPEFTLRQRGYASARGDGKIYTPQMVVNGVTHAVGSDRAAVTSKCKLSNASMSVPITAAKGDSALDLIVGAWPDNGDEPPRARVYLVSFAKQVSVPIRAGENAGKTATYANVVQSVREIGYWHGDALPLRVFWNPADTQGGAVLLQAIDKNGPSRIYGAALLP